jgi:hypothetical protein
MLTRGRLCYGNRSIPAEPDPEAVNCWTLIRRGCRMLRVGHRPGIGKQLAPDFCHFRRRTRIMGVVQNLPFSGYTGMRKAPACEDRISTGDVSCAGGGQPPQVKPAGAEAVPGPAE